MKTQLVLITYHNGGEFLYRIKSAKKITINKVAKYFEKTESWNEDRDSITFLDEPITEINYDNR